MTHSRDHVGCVLTAGPWEQGRPPKLATLVQMWSQGMLSPLPNTKPEMTPQAVILGAGKHHGFLTGRQHGGLKGQLMGSEGKWQRHLKHAQEGRQPGQQRQAGSPGHGDTGGPGRLRRGLWRCPFPQGQAVSAKVTAHRSKEQEYSFPGVRQPQGHQHAGGKWNPTPQHLDLVPPTQDPRYQPNHCWEQAQPPGQQEMSKTSTQRRITACI